MYLCFSASPVYGGKFSISESDYDTSHFREILVPFYAQQLWETSTEHCRAEHGSNILVLVKTAHYVRTFWYS